MDSQEIAETARKALQVLDEDGWCQGFLEVWRDSEGNGGEHCLGGAWNIALHGESAWSSRKDDYQPVVDVIKAQYPEFLLSCFSPGSCYQAFIAEWNNRLDRTEAEVRAILEKLVAQ